MNILISTTTNHNVGDSFILFGVKNILKHIFPDANYINYDRNPNNMIDWPHDQNMKKGLHGTFMNNPIDFSKIDLVVLAGSPEFLHHPLTPIYDGLINHLEIPLWAIGVGYSEPQFVLPLTPNEKTILKRESTLVISRQMELAIRLAPYLSTPFYCEPCPALFCFEDLPEKTKQELDTKDAYTNTDPYDVLRIIGQHKKIKTDRLHGAIAGISSGGNVTLTNDSFRVKSAIALFEDVLMCDDIEKIKSFKEQTFNKYINILNHARERFDTARNTSN